jgi:hypothetical protein
MPSLIVGAEQPAPPASLLWPGVGPFSLVRASFPLAIESTETVLAALLTGTWSGDFGGDFGPYFGGGAPVEMLIGTATTSVAGNAYVPLEALVAARGGAARTENAALFTWDSLPALEAGFTARTDGWPPVEGQASARSDPPVAAEAPSLQRGDAISAAEDLLTARADPPGQVELLRAQAADPPQEIEAGSQAARSDPVIPIEFLATHPVGGALRGDSFAPIEVLLTARSPVSSTGQAYHPVEWAALFRSDTLPPAETVPIVRVEPTAPAESGAVWRLDILPPAEALSLAARSDLRPPIEALLSAMRSGALAEFGLLVRVDTTAPAEAGETVRVDPGAPAEAGAAAARADALAPIEVLTTAAGVAQAPAKAGVEWLSAVRTLVVIGNSQSPLEWIGTIRADGMPGIEDAALFRADPAALAEWFRSLGVDWQTPTESAQTSPAPLFFVTRGRLR